MFLCCIHIDPLEKRKQIRCGHFRQVRERSQFLCILAGRRPGVKLQLGRCISLVLRIDVTVGGTSGGSTTCQAQRRFPQIKIGIGEVPSSVVLLTLLYNAQKAETLTSP